MRSGAFSTRSPARREQASARATGARRAVGDHPRDRRPHEATRRRRAARGLSAARREGDRRREAHRRRGRSPRGRGTATRERRGASRSLAARHRRRAGRRRGDACCTKLGAIARQLAVDPTDRSHAVAAAGVVSTPRTTRIEALARELEEYEASVELDPARLDDVRRRRDLLFRLTKKYGGTLADVIRAGDEARAELDLVDSAGLDIRQLEARERAARGDAQRARGGAHRSCASRRGATRARRRRGAAGPRHARRPSRPSRCTRCARSVGHGAEDVEFRVALNVGHEPRALARVASGGELSRVMLALKTILARLDRVPTLIFDEVDAGIGGRVGLQVGETMRRVAAAPSGVRHHAPAADRRARAPSHSGQQGRARRRDDGRRGRDRAVTTRVARDRAHAGRRSGERDESGARPRAARLGSHPGARIPKEKDAHPDLLAHSLRHGTTAAADRLEVIVRHLHRQRAPHRPADGHGRIGEAEAKCLRSWTKQRRRRRSHWRSAMYWSAPMCVSMYSPLNVK